MSDRPETGPMQFGDDWCGVFIRGDNAAYFAMSLMTLLQNSDPNDVLPRLVLQGLVSELISCTGNPETAQKMKAFNEAKQTDETK